jgi:hypothetical protein
VEAQPGEKLNGTMIHTWLQVLTDRAYNCAWDSIITINGKLLTQHYAEITPAEDRAHAQTYQNEGRRKAQNAEMLINAMLEGIHYKDCVLQNQPLGGQMDNHQGVQQVSNL